MCNQIVGIGFRGGFPWTIATLENDGYDIDIDDDGQCVAECNGCGGYVDDGAVSFADEPEEVWFADGYRPAKGDLPRRAIDETTLRQLRVAIEESD